MKNTHSAHIRRRTEVLFQWVVLLVAGPLAASSVAAKDLYLATTGSDSISYAANDQANPWATLEHAMTNIQGGDTLFIRAGTYIATTNQSPSVSGTQSSPTWITSFPGEAVTIDLSNIIFAWLELDGVDWWELSDLEFVNVMQVVNIAQARISDNHVIRNNRVLANRGGDNVSAFRVQPNGRFIRIDGNEVIGAGLKASGINHNTSCVYMERASNVQIINNTFSNCVVGVHYKHSPSNGGGSNVEVAYNLIFGTDEVIRYNGNNSHIHDNIFGPNSGLGTVGMENGSPGGDNNVFEHNTFAGGTLSLTDAGGGVQNNVVRDNIFLDWSPYEEIDICRWTVCNHNTSLDYNLHQSGTAVQEYQVAYNLAQWRSYYGGSVNSIEGTAVFQGGVNPVTPDDYRLAPSSPGVGAASDGTDMGARIDLFGTSGLSLVRPNPPGTLTAN